MTLVFWNGKLLFDHGKLAKDPNCCCSDGGPCCCPNLSVGVGFPKVYPTLKLTITSSCAKINGLVCNLLPGALVGGCVVEWNGSVTVGGCPAFPIVLGFSLTCEGSLIGCNRFRLSHGLNSSACNPLGGEFNRIPDSTCTCVPLSLVFKSLFPPCHNPLDPGAECSCCSCADVFTATITL